MFGELPTDEATTPAPYTPIQMGGVVTAEMTKPTLLCRDKEHISNLEKVKYNTENRAAWEGREREVTVATAHPVSPEVIHLFAHKFNEQIFVECLMPCWYIAC